MVHQGQSQAFSVLLCHQCEIGFSLPPLSDAELAPFYPDDYEAYVPKSSLVKRLQQHKYRMDYKLIQKNSPLPRPSIFEIGSGRGEWLAVAKAMGSQVGGLEPGEAGRKYAKEHAGIDLQAGYASELKFKERYDVVVARHVLEHINDPRACLKTVLATGLKPGGKLLLKLPKLDSWESRRFGNFWCDFDLPRHRFHFTGVGIRRLLESVGFVDVRVELEVVPVAITQSFDYLEQFAPSGRLKTLAKWLNRLPSPLRLAACQIAALLLAPTKSAGRMIVWATKPAAT